MVQAGPGFYLIHPGGIAKSKTGAAVTLHREDHWINLGGNAEVSLSSLLWDGGLFLTHRKVWICFNRYFSLNGFLQYIQKIYWLIWVATRKKSLSSLWG
ncbi:MAG TPA: hypothetical protein DHV55_14595 [Clostridiaceae bacterium]|nr:hypothetical protein [Clostridiaceae bacterium]